MPEVSHKFLRHYDKCMDAFIQIEALFENLDAYRAKRQDRFHLYRAHDKERIARKLMKEIKQENQELVK